MAEKISVKVRKSHGKREARRLRRDGMVPAVLYGHGQKPVSLTVAADALATALRHGARVVELAGEVTDKALIRELQMDTYGVDLVHVDFSRVSEHERVKLRVRLEIRGHAAGIKDGGVVEQHLHEVDIECEAFSIPEKIELNVSELPLDGSITVGQLQPPAGVKVLTNAEVVVVQCVKPKEEGEAAPAEAAVVEPEVIGRKPTDEAEEEE